jgi:hypothetical protein
VPLEVCTDVLKFIFGFNTFQALPYFMFAKLCYIIQRLFRIAVCDINVVRLVSELSCHSCYLLFLFFLS